MPITVARAYVVQLDFKTNETAMAWMIIIAIMGPAQGFLNALVFFNRINGSKKLCRGCTGDKKTDKTDNSPLKVSGSAFDKEKHSAAPCVSSVTQRTHELAQTSRTMEPILQDAGKHKNQSKAVESGEESKIDEETIQAAEAEMDEFAPKVVISNKGLKILQDLENDSKENNWAAAEEFLALTKHDGKRHTPSWRNSIAIKE